MGKAVLKNPRVVTVTDPVFGPRKEVQADLYNTGLIVITEEGIQGIQDKFVCIVSLGSPVEPDEESALPITT